MRLSFWLPLLAVASLGVVGCDSKQTSTVNTEAQAIFDVFDGCFEGLWKFADGVIDIAETWELEGDDNPPDPAELSWSFNGQGIDVTLAVDTAVVSMTINAYGPNGVNEQRDCSALSAAGPIQPVTSLSEAIDNIATELRDEFSTSNPFLHGVWSISGGGISATAEGLLGVIGGSTNANELERVSTVAALVGVGLPAGESSTITDTVSTPNCTLTFETTEGLFTDEQPGSEFPRGRILVTLNDGTRTVEATIAFDKSQTAVISVTGLSDTFSLDLVTGEVSF